MNSIATQTGRRLELTPQALDKLGIPPEKRDHVLIDARWLLDWAARCRFPESATRYLEENRGKLVALLLTRWADPQGSAAYEYQLLDATA
jgi:hypothetical protein